MTLGRDPGGTDGRLVPRIARRTLASALVGALAAFLASEVSRADERRGSAVAAAQGDWPEWRGTRFRTGQQALPGRISTPEVKMRYRIGGRLSPEQTLFCSDREGGPATELFISPSGTFQKLTPDGEGIWSRQVMTDLRILGCLRRDGVPENVVLTGTSDLSGSRLMLFDGKSGDRIWMSERAPGQLGAIKIFRRGGDRGFGILWLPAAGSSLRAFGYDPANRTVDPVWETRLTGFVSDPHSYSLLTVDDGRPGTKRTVWIWGARGAVSLRSVDLETGRELSTITLNPSVTGWESGGAGDLFMLEPEAQQDLSEAIVVSSYASQDSYMFQGAAVLSPGRPEEIRVAETSPIGLRYTSGSVQDFDCDGRKEIVVSLYSLEDQSHTLIVLDARSLGVIARVPDLYLVGVVQPPGEEGPTILGWRGISDEKPGQPGELAVLQIRNGKMVSRDWYENSRAPIALAGSMIFKGRIENAGDDILTTGGTTEPEFTVLYGDAGVLGGPYSEIVCRDPRRREGGRRFSEQSGIALSVLAVHRGRRSSESRIVVFEGDGTLVILDGLLRVKGRREVGGYFRESLLGYRSRELAAIVDLTGSGRRSVVVMDSRQRILGLDFEPGWGHWSVVNERVLWNSGVGQELLAVPLSTRAHGLVVSGIDEDGRFLGLIDGEATERWRSRLSDRSLSGTKRTAPAGLGTLRTGSEKRTAIVYGTGRSGVYPLETRTLWADTGQRLWASARGGYGNVAFAAVERDDGCGEDVALSFNGEHGILLDGETGEPAAEQTHLPEYGDLGDINYLGVPVSVPGTGGSVAILNAADTGHAAFLSLIPGTDSSGEGPRMWIVWAAEQERPDDERFSMPAIAVSGDSSWLACVGSATGWLKARRGIDGAAAWEVAPVNGELVPRPKTEGNILSSVVALDVNGDGRMEFVVGGADGWLYAVSADRGDLVWSLDIGHSLGDPVAGDLDGDGRSEIVVPAADGFLYVIGGIGPTVR